jgi:ribonuclease HII
MASARDPFKGAGETLSLFSEEGLSGPDPLFYEELAQRAGYGRVAGVDEAGRGPLAGPVVAAAVILPRGLRLEGVRDSKQMTPRARERAFDRIVQQAVAAGVGVASREEIDALNILRASLEAMKRALDALDPRPDFVLVDGIQAVPLPLPQRCLKKGDRLSHSISAASIVAKVYRDRIMRVYHESYPVYGFCVNMGYGTRDHLEAIRKYGPSPLHRRTFRGVCGLDQREA